MDDAALLAALPGWAFAFALVLSRTGMAVMLLPGLGEAEPPPIVRAGLALATYATNSNQWTPADKTFLAAQLVAANPEHQPRLREYLRFRHVFRQAYSARMARPGAASDAW